MCVECLRNVAEGREMMHIVTSTVLASGRLAIAVDVGTSALAGAGSESGRREG